MEYQTFGFGGFQLEHKITGEAAQIPPDGFVEVEGRYSIQRGQVGIQHDPESADQQDAALDAFRPNRECHNLYTNEAQKSSLARRSSKAEALLSEGFCWTIHVDSRSGKWLPDPYDSKNSSCLQLPVAARRCQQLTRPARIEQVVPVALVRRAKGRCSLIRREEAGNARPVSLKPWDGRSVIAIAQECAALLRAGKAEAEAAEMMRLSRCKMRNLMALLTLPEPIKAHLVRTRDMEGRIGERQLRALLKTPGERPQLGAFRRMVLAMACEERELKPPKA